jgi:hypothetical protein
MPVSGSGRSATIRSCDRVRRLTRPGADPPRTRTHRSLPPCLSDVPMMSPPGAVPAPVARMRCPLSVTTAAALVSSRSSTGCGTADSNRVKRYVEDAVDGDLLRNAEDQPRGEGCRGWPPVTHEQMIRMAKMGLPPRLGSTQLDPVTGHIEYPLALTSAQFAPYRDELNKLFADRASSGGSICSAR